MYTKFIPIAIICFLLFGGKGFSQTAYDWTYIGTGFQTSDPYPFYYYKLAQLNNINDRYATIFEVSVAGDANYYEQQGTYTVRIGKYEGTTTGTVDGPRFDGVEVRCTSGSPGAATFYISGTELWVKSNYLWGGLYYRVVANFVQSPMVPDIPATQTLSAPANVVYVATQNGVIYDFDRHLGFAIPATDNYGSIVRGLNINSQLDNTLPRPAVGANTIAGEIRGTSSAGPLMDDGFLRLSAGGGSTPGTKTFIDISGYMADATNDRIDNITFGTQGLERMRLDLNGNLAIGTTDAKGYKLAVNGNAVVNKLVVKATANWPDYVFDSTYQLPSLASVEQYIHTHQHLEGVPAAATVKKEDVDVGAMQAVLLKKLEEVTLYLIQLQKENDALKVQVKQLQQH